MTSLRISDILALCWEDIVDYSAGITKNITFHSYRRTFATLQAAAGTDIRTIQSIMAHKSITTTQRYIKVLDANKREASKKITLTRKG